MFPEEKRLRPPIWIGMAILIMSGCDEGDARVTKVALEAAQQQAAQNEEMARLDREVAEGTRHLVESRGKSDEQLLTQQSNLQTQRDELDHERRAIASERTRESLLSPVLSTVGSLFVCSLPLVLCWLLLNRLAQESAETDVTQILVDRLTLAEQCETPDEDSICLPGAAKPALKSLASDCQHDR